MYKSKTTDDSLANILKALLYQRVNPIDLAKKIYPEELIEDSAIAIFNTCIELATDGKDYYLKAVIIKMDAAGILDNHKEYIHKIWTRELPGYHDIDQLEEDIVNLKLAYKRKSVTDFFTTASFQLAGNPEKIEEVIKQMSEFGQELKVKQSESSVVKISQDLLPLLTDMLNGVSEMKGTPLFGVNELDSMIRGYVPGDVILIAGRPKMGKSTTENTIMVNLIRSDIKFAAFSGEQRNQTRWINLLAGLSDQSYVAIEEGTGYDFKRIEYAYEILANKEKERHFHLYQDQLSLPFLRERVMYHYYKDDVRMFLIDRIGLFKEIDARNDHTSRTSVTSAIRTLANELGVTFVLFSQANANLDSTLSKRPTPSSVYGNTGVLANCTKGLLLYRPEEYGFTEFPDDSKKYRGTPCAGKIEVIAAIGNRIGRGSVRLNFDYERVMLKTETFGSYETRDVPF